MNMKIAGLIAVALVVTIAMGAVVALSGLFLPKIEKQTGVFEEVEVVSGSPDETYTNAASNGSKTIIRLCDVDKGWIVDTYNGMCTFVALVDGEYVCAQYLQLHHLDTSNLTEGQLSDKVQEPMEFFANIDKDMRTELNYAPRLASGIGVWAVVMAVIAAMIRFEVVKARR